MSANNPIVSVPASESIDSTVNSVSPSAIIGDVDAHATTAVALTRNRTPANTASPSWGEECDEQQIVPVISARSTPVNGGLRTHVLFQSHDARILALESQVRDLTNSHNALLVQFQILIEKLNANVTQPTVPAPTNTANVSVIERVRASKPTVSVPPPPAVQPQKKPIDVKFLTCVRNSLAKMSQDQRNAFDVCAVPPIKDGKSIEQILTDLGHPHTIEKLAYLQNKEGNLIAFNATYLIIDQLIGNIKLSDTDLVAMLQ